MTGNWVCSGVAEGFQFRRHSDRGVRGRFAAAAGVGEEGEEAGVQPAAVPAGSSLA